MKGKLLTLIPMIGVTAAAPVAIATVSQTKATNVQALNADEEGNKNGEEYSLEIENRLIQLKSINKSCDKLFTFTEAGANSCYEYSNINTMISVEKEGQPGVKDGKIERGNLFTFSSETTKYQKYCRYKSNHIDKSNVTSWGNAKKYQLNVTVPANTKDYKVQVVANCKLKNCINAFNGNFTTLYDSGVWYRQRTFMQGNLSRLSIDPNEILMPAMGTTTSATDTYYAKNDNTIKGKDSVLLDWYQDWDNFYEKKPYVEAELTNEITLSNETAGAKEIPVYFWFGFFGGGYTCIGSASQINCDEVWFSANHIA